MDKEHPIQMLPGIGPNRAARLQKLGIETADDLLRWFPRQYEDRRTVYPVEGAPVGGEMLRGSGGGGDTPHQPHH